MKKRAICLLALAVALACLLSGCGVLSAVARGRDPRYGMSDTQVWERLLTALDAGDQEAFAALFCEDTASMPGFEEQVAELFAFYQGQSVESRCTGGVEQGMLTDYVEKNYELVTSQERYSISFSYLALDREFEDQRENWGKISSRTGLNAVLLLTQELADEAEYTQWPQGNGVFVLRTLADCDR